MSFMTKEKPLTFSDAIVPTQVHKYGVFPLIKFRKQKSLEGRIDTVHWKPYAFIQ